MKNLNQSVWNFLISKISICTLIVLLFLSVYAMADTQENTRTIMDMRGKEVHIPGEINRVVTIDDGLIEGVMTILDESDKIVGLASSSLQKSSEATIPSGSSTNYTYKNGMNPVGYLNPQFANLPLVEDSSTGVNLETVASLNPDIIIIRLGSCAAPWEMSDDGSEKNIDNIEKLGIPIVVVKAPPSYADPDISKMSDEIKVIGEIFGKEKQAEKIVEYLDNCVDMITDRTADVQEDEKPRVLALGLSPQSRSAGGAGNVRGAIIANYIEKIANANNAFTVEKYVSDSGIISAEQVLALDPDVIILPTSSGYHPPCELYSAPYYENLRELRAVKDRKVYSLAFTPRNCDASRLEYPIDLMIIAKGSYPDRFKDITVSDWALDFYQKLYDVNEETAKGMRSSHWLDWMNEENF